MRPLVRTSGQAGRYLADGLTVVFALAALGLAAWAIGWRRKTGEMQAPAGAPPRIALETAVVIILGLLIPSIMWDHYLVVLLFPQIVLLADLVARGKKAWPGMLALGVASVIVAWPVAFHRPEFSEGIGLLAMSAKLYGVLILFGLAIATLSLRHSGGARGTDRRPCSRANGHLSVDNLRVGGE